MYTIIPYQDNFVKFDQVVECYQIFGNRIVSLVNENTFSFDFVNEWQELVDQFHSRAGIKVIHLFYEFAVAKELNHHLKELIQNDYCLGYMILYRRHNLVSGESFEKSSVGVTFDASLDQAISLEDYKDAFDKVYQHLVEGDCYQVNLTNQFRFSLTKLSNQSLESVAHHFAHKIWKRDKVGAFGSMTVLSPIQKLLFSNSPECLLQVEKLSNQKEKFAVRSMPIKGTVKYEDDDNFYEAWNNLISCSKNSAELDMITDLIRNDLSRLGTPKTKVIKQKVPLRVPGLLHQYSLVEVKVAKTPRTSALIDKMFAGGSITGAPKKRVMEIIREIESSQRGFYCGSTIISYKDYLCSSINIRSMSYDHSRAKLYYGAGGGVTLQSNFQDEFNEMLMKVRSFSNLLDFPCGN